MFTQESINVFWQTISVMVKGMGGIFLFMFVFYWIVIGLDKFFPKETEKENDQA